MSGTKNLNLNDIKSLIPHRDPFLFLDSVDILNPGLEAKGFFYVRENLSFFKGHFPKYPIMPGVLIIESIAQTSAVCAMDSLPKEQQGKNTFFLKINNATFRKGVLPKDELIISVKLKRKIGNASIFDCVAQTKDDNGNIVLNTESQIMATIEK